MNNKNSFGLYKGWLVTIASTLVLLLLGVIYAWSVFKANIPDEWGWSEAQKSLPYSVIVLVVALANIIGAWMMLRLKPGIIICMGGILAGCGLIISSLTSSPLLFTLGFGVILGTGIGFAYGCAILPPLKWFPASRSGLVAGIVVSGFGLSSVWVAPAAKSLIGFAGFQTALLYFGIGLLLLVTIISQFIQLPPKENNMGASYESMHFMPGSMKDYMPSEMIKTWQFRLIFISYALCGGAGLMIIGNLAPIVKSQMALPALSAIAVMALAIGNGIGRIIYGNISDRIGRRATLIIAILFQASLIFMLSFAVQGSMFVSNPVVITMVALIGANYGANLALFPTLTKDYFGLNYFAVNYGIVNLACGVGGFLISQVAGIIMDVRGSFNLAYYLAALLLLLSAMMMGLLNPPKTI